MPKLHPLVERILKERAIENVDEFLNPSYTDRPNPFLIADMDVAVSRIGEALEKKEKIAAWTDYDCDGIPAGALLSHFFRSIAHPVRSYIPERSEGYGLNRAGILKLKEEGITLIITADVGITDIEEAAFAKEHGIDIIISDHHLPGDVLPEAVAVLNPHRADCPYPEKDLCGTGVAFKLVEALIRKNSDLRNHYFSWNEGQEKWLLDLVALATVADMVPLLGENRTLVRYGLVVLSKGRHAGLRALMETMRIPLSAVTEDDIAFSIAPKINAASRMKSPHLALELLTTEDDERARTLARELVKLNDARKLEGARVAKEVKRRLEGAPLDEVIVLGNPSWNPALLGIAATNVVETYRRPVCLWGKDGELIKGSCRSDGSVNIVSLMSASRELFDDYGGHERSGGFSLKSASVHALPDALRKAYETLASEQQTIVPDEKPEADGALALSEATEAAYRALRTLAPFGVGNPKPVFAVPGTRVERVLRFGKHGEHVRLALSDDNGTVRDAVGFFTSRNLWHAEAELVSAGDAVVLNASLEQSFFAGRKELRLRLEHLSFSE